MTEELCSTLLFPAPAFPKEEAVLNTYRKIVWRQEGGKEMGGAGEEEGSYKFVRLASLWANIPTGNLPDMRYNC
jgi:hypothetical protein